MKSPLGSLLKPRNASGKPPIPLGDGATAARRGLSYSLGNGRADAETFMRQYGMSGTIFGIVSLLAESTATPAWHLYKKAPQDGRRRYSTGDKGSDQRVEVVQHAAIQLWNNPNDWHSGFEFREGCQQHQELTGETFWVLDMEAGFPTSMWYVRPDRMEPVPDPDDYLVGWIYKGPSGEQVPLKADEVILEKRPDPLDPYRGAGPVASILPNIQQQRYATEYQRNLFLNGADPGGIITVPTKLSDAEFDTLIDRWREAHRGVSRAGHVGVLEDGAIWTPNAHTNKDMEYGELRLANRDELREAWRIHKHMMGSADDVNRANAQTAEEVFVSWQNIPRLNRRRDTLNTKLLPLFGRADKTMEFDYDDPSPKNAEAAADELLKKTQSAQALVAAGYDSEDVLEVVGLPSMGWAAPQPSAPAAPGLGAQPGTEVQDRTRQIINITPPPGPQPTPPPPGQGPPQQVQPVDAQWKAAVAALAAAWLLHVMPSWHAALLIQIRARIEAGNLAGLAALSVDPDAAATLILEHTSAYAAAAAGQAVAEAEAQGVTGVAAQVPAQAVLTAAANTAAELQARQVALSAGREAARVAGADPDVEDVIKQVQAFLAGQSNAPVVAASSGVLSAAQNHARLATIAAGPRARLVATEMHDGNTCDPCDKIDGKVFGYSDEPAAVTAAAAAYPAGGYVLCEGGARCRGTMYADYTTATNLAVRGGKDPAAKVFQQVAEDFPPSATAWMHHASWSGPLDVPLAHINWTPDEMEGTDPGRIRQFVDKLRAGKKLKPVILVKTPSGSTLSLVDGHHRFLAAAELKKPVRAFVGVVDSDEGPWQIMHDQQYPGRGRQPAAVSTAGAIRVQTGAAHALGRVLVDGWTPIETAGRR